jgi:hypothetical protein
MSGSERRCRQCRAPILEPSRCQNGHAQPVDDPYDLLAERLVVHIDYERLAELVAERLERFIPALAAQVAPESGGLVDAKTIARQIGKQPRWVREHKQELGGVPLGNGLRPRWGFDPDVVRRRLEHHDGDGGPPPTPPASRRPLPANVELLPVRDDPGGKAA